MKNCSISLVFGISDALASSYFLFFAPNPTLSNAQFQFCCFLQIKKGWRNHWDGEGNIGQLQFAATEKTDLEAQTMVLPLFTLPPPIRKARA